MSMSRSAGIRRRLSRLIPWTRERSGKPRILFCTMNFAPGSSGGAERQAQLQADELHRRGYEVSVVCPGEPGYRSGMVNGISVHRLRVRWAGRGRRPMHLLGLGWFLLTHLHRFDLVHVHLAGLQTEVAVPIARLFRKPVYVKMAAGGPRGDVLRYFSLPGLPRRYGLRNAQRLQVITEQIGADLRSVGIDEARTVRIPNGVALGRFSAPTEERRRELRERLGLPVDRVIALYVGRLEPPKGVLDLAAVWPEIHKESGALLLLVGGSPWGTVTPESLKTEGIEARDWAKNIVDYYQAADIFVLASHSEGMSNAMLEAMACGLAVVATRVGAAEELLDGGRVGLLVPPADPPQLRAALRTVVLDEPLRGRLGRDAAEFVQRYSIQSVVDRIEREYAGLLKRQ